MQQSVSNETTPRRSGRQLRQVTADDESGHFEDVEGRLITADVGWGLWRTPGFCPGGELLLDGVESCASWRRATSCGRLLTFGRSRAFRWGLAEADGAKAWPRRGDRIRLLRPSPRTLAYGRGADSVRTCERRSAFRLSMQRWIILVVDRPSRFSGVGSSQLAADRGQRFSACGGLSDFDFRCGLWVHGPHGRQTRRAEFLGDRRQCFPTRRSEPGLDLRWRFHCPFRSASDRLRPSGGLPLWALRVAPLASSLSQTDPTIQQSIARIRACHKVRQGARHT